MSDTRYCEDCGEILEREGCINCNDDAFNAHQEWLNDKMECEE